MDRWRPAGMSATLFWKNEEAFMPVPAGYRRSIGASLFEIVPKSQNGSSEVERARYHLAYSFPQSKTKKSRIIEKKL